MVDDLNLFIDKENKALEFIQVGKYKEAEELYKFLVRKKSKTSAVYINLAVLMKLRGERGETINLLQKAINLEPSSPIAYSNLGIEFIYIGDIKNAILSYEKAIDLNPNYAEAHNNYGQVMQLTGKLDMALASYERAISLNPNYAEAQFNLGNALKQNQDIIGAIKRYQISIKLNPNFSLAYNNLGIIFKENFKYEDAIKNFQNAISIDSKYSDAHLNLGNTLYEIKDYSKSIIAYKKCLKLNPEYKEVFNNLGNVYRDMGLIEKAIFNYQKCISLDKEFYYAYCNIGKLYQWIDNLNLAKDYYLKALNINPEHLETLSNYGVLKQIEGEIEEAHIIFKNCVKKNPDFPDANLNLAYIQLLMGDYTNGWENYEWRTKTKDPLNVHCQPKSEKWDEKEVFIKDKLIVISEQGLGDNFQFMRYIPYMKKKGVEIIYCVPKKLHSLIISSNITSKPLTLQEGASLEKYKWTSILTLPKLLKVNPSNPLINDPYLFAPDELKAKWKNIFKKEDKPIVGINWQGNPKAEKENLKGRSIPLAKFSSIANNGFKFLSLQKGYGSDQLKKCKFKKNFVNFQNDVNKIMDFAEIAAIIINCKIVITSDSCVAHIAGGLGIETWLLLHYVPDWRWGISDDKTFWYPSLKIFRQKNRDDWEEVFNRIKLKLETLKDFKNV